MNNKSTGKIILWSIVGLAVLIGVGFLTQIHTESVENTALVKINCTETEEKTIMVGEEEVRCIEDYYAYFDGTQVVVEDKDTWDLIKENERYDISYEWYGTKTPTLASINQAGEGDAGGSH